MSGLRAVARDLVWQEAAASTGGVHTGRTLAGADEPFEEDWDEEDMLALEEELLRTIERERAAEEAEWLQEQQEAEDRELYEQHLLGGVPCPLCGSGRLERREGELCCSGCMMMRVPLLDDSLDFDDIMEMLGEAERRHRKGGCSRHASFVVCELPAGASLCLQCGDCGWSELVL
mmetsp:Transcript_72848/g.142883  ORF Transcript_72848/g.142883 Transcript_72848/m.142883 type:complete len:175 (+) Transcript_72848:1-525(+)